MECSNDIKIDGKFFCCEGCKQVHLLIHEIESCSSDQLVRLKDIRPRGKFADDRWEFLNEPTLINQVVVFKSTDQIHVHWSLPDIHCASCIWLLENLNRIHSGVITSKIDFEEKKGYFVIHPGKIKLSELAALLHFLGYPPAISHASASIPTPTNPTDRKAILRLGVAGFCFSNIMMLSFPDYLALNGLNESLLHTTFTYLSVALSIPVVIYSAAPFFIQAWKGLRQRFINIDVPIALAIAITYIRSLYEIFTSSGTGYLDSMSGIVFFMLIGRWFQDRTQKTLSFERDYKSYFPMSALTLQGDKRIYKSIETLQPGDIVQIRHQEIIPADSKHMEGDALIDYSFVTGEKNPIPIKSNELIYAGGRQAGAAIQIEVLKPVATSHLTQLWNNQTFLTPKNKEKSFVHPWSQYFSIALFSIALISGIYWQWNDPAQTWKAVTSILIVACPCSLLLTASFSYGNLMGLMNKMGLFLKNARIIERMEEADTIVFDKTGTLTSNRPSDFREPEIEFKGKPISYKEKCLIKALTSQSSHPLSRVLSESQEMQEVENTPPTSQFHETEGQGIEAECEGHRIKMGKVGFVCNIDWVVDELQKDGSSVHVSIDGMYKGRYIIHQRYRPGIFESILKLKKSNKEIHVISGDATDEKKFLASQLGDDVSLRFNMSPSDKLEYIVNLQRKGKNVIMIGDGLNDAGALQQSNAGIAVSDQSNYFTPASDGILDGQSMMKIDQLFSIAKKSKHLIAYGFTLSILYNIIGLSFATQARLSPMIAAILMPASTLSIILLAYLGTRFMGKTDKNHVLN